jgi:hypothetical protein
MLDAFSRHVPICNLPFLVLDPVPVRLFPFIIEINNYVRSEHSNRLGPGANDSKPKDNVARVSSRNNSIDPDHDERGVRLDPIHKALCIFIFLSGRTGEDISDNCIPKLAGLR